MTNININILHYPGIPFPLIVCEATILLCFYRVLLSAVVPMGWIVNSKMLGKYGSNWQHAMCVAWYEKDRQDMRWMERLEYCPCNLQQALSDFGRWQTDVGCNLYSDSPTKCRFHLGAVHCVRAVQPSR